MVLYTTAGDPHTYEEAEKDQQWRAAVDNEIVAIKRNDTWELTVLPNNSRKIGVKWIYKTKLNEKGEVDKYKARLVAKGYAQQHGIDYTEVFTPVARWDTIRMVLAIATQRKWKVYQLDVKSAFLHGKLDEDVYVEQPLGYEKKGEEHKVLKLKKALYGLKQAPRAWFSRIETYFVKEGFARCPSEHTLFVKIGEDKKILIIFIYVDDLVFTGSDEGMFAVFKASMKREFDMTDLGKMKFFLGVEVVQNDEGIYLSQRKYALEVLERFGLEKANSVRNPMIPGMKLMRNEDGEQVDVTQYKQMVGSLMYLLVTRPDLMFGIGLISRYMERPTTLHMQAIKTILRYVKGSVNLSIHYRREAASDERLMAYSDSDYAGDQDDRRSTSGYVFMLSEGVVAWSSKKQPVVSLSTTEAEFISAAHCACQAVWMRRVLERIDCKQGTYTIIHCDNMSSIKLAKNPIMHGRSKHIDVRFYFLCELCKEGVIELKHCNTQDQIADIMTKALKMDAFEKLRSLLGVCEVLNE